MAMRQAARSIEEQFAILQDRCNIGLLRRHDNEYTDGGSSKVAEDRETAVYRVAAQIKLLVDTPEQIWFSLERALYLQSAQLYLLAKHVYANLQSGNDSVSANALVRSSCVCQYAGPAIDIHRCRTFSPLLGDNGTPLAAFKRKSFRKRTRV